VKIFLKRFYVVLLLLLSLSSPSWGKPVSPGEALQAVKGWLTLGSSPMEEKLGAAGSKMRMFGDAAEVFSQERALYYAVFLAPKGIVFVPADDLVEPILAWQPEATDYNLGEDSPFQTTVIADLKLRVKEARKATAKLYGLQTGGNPAKNKISGTV
jgi:hypothetical protein